MISLEILACENNHFSSLLAAGDYNHTGWPAFMRHCTAHFHSKIHVLQIPVKWRIQRLCLPWRNWAPADSCMVVEKPLI